MRLLLALSLLVGVSAVAEPLRLKKSTVVKTDHGALIVSAGTVVEVVTRTPAELRILYKGEKGTIAIGNNAIELAPDPGIDPSRPISKKVQPTAVAATSAGSASPSTPAPAAPASNGSPVRTDNPQSFYGRVIRKAEGAADQHDKNLVAPANTVTGDGKN